MKKDYRMKSILKSTLLPFILGIIFGLVLITSSSFAEELPPEESTIQYSIDDVYNILDSNFALPTENDVIETVTKVFSFLMLSLFGIYPIMSLFRKLVNFSASAFDLAVIKRLEGGGMFSFLNEKDGALSKKIESLGDIRIFKKYIGGNK